MTADKLLKDSRQPAADGGAPAEEPSDGRGAKIILAAGGTGGHVFPAIATAEGLVKRGFKVYFATDVRGEKYLKNSGYEYKIISSASLAGNLKQRLGGFFKLFWGMLQSGFYLGVIRPKVVVGFGGYPSFPPLLAAKINMIKTVLHEQNSVLGKANRFLAKYATVTAVSFPNTKNSKNSRLVGNPVRAAIVETSYPALDSKLNILITGGSQGARIFSQTMPGVIGKYADKVTVSHQVKDNEVATIRELYKAAGVTHEVKSFFDDMSKRLENAHLVICRAGASTLFELVAAARPAIFVPLPSAAENHQYYNAKAVCDIGGGWLLEEKDFNQASVSAILKTLLNDHEQLHKAAENIKKFATPDAAGKLADLITGLIK